MVLNFMQQYQIDTNGKGKKKKKKILSLIFFKNRLWIDGADHHDMIEVLGLDLYVKNMNDFIQYSKDNHSKITGTIKKIDIKMNVDTKVDDSKPTTSLQVQLVNGEKVKGVFNLTQTVNDVYDWISETTGLKTDSFDLLTSYPKKNLNDEKEKSLDDEKLGGSTLIQSEKIQQKSSLSLSTISSK